MVNGLFLIQWLQRMEMLDESLFESLCSEHIASEFFSGYNSHEV